MQTFQTGVDDEISLAPVFTMQLSFEVATYS